MKRYVGTKSGSLDWSVEVEEAGETRPLPLRLDLASHSPDGFSWGYGGSGPAQLALALIADATDDDSVAVRFYQQFKDEVVARIPSDHSWEMTSRDVLDAVGEMDVARMMSRRDHMSWGAGDVEIEV